MFKAKFTGTDNFQFVSFQAKRWKLEKRSRQADALSELNFMISNIRNYGSNKFENNSLVQTSEAEPWFNLPREDGNSNRDTNLNRQ